MARMGDKRGAYTDSMERSEGKKPFGKPRRRWTDNIKLDLKETGLPGVIWIYLDQERDKEAACLKDVLGNLGFHKTWQIS